MKILSTAYITLISYLRNKVVLIFFILGPIGFVLIMQGTDYKVNINNKEKVGYCFNTEDRINKGVLELLSSDKSKEKIELKEYKTLNDGLEEIKKGDLDNLIYSEGHKELKLYNTNSFSSVNIILDSYLTEVKKHYFNIKNEDIKNEDIKNEAVETSKIKTEGIVPNKSFRILMAGTITLLFYVSILTAYTMIKNHKNKTYIRLKCSSMKNIEAYLGISIGNISLMTIALIVVLLTAKLVIGINYSMGIFKLILVAILFFFFSSNLGAMVTYISKNIFIDGLMLFAINYLFVFPVMTEAFDPGGRSIKGIKDIINTINSYSPHHYCYEGMIGSLYSNITGTNQAVLMVGAAAVITMVIVMVLERRKAYERI